MPELVALQTMLPKLDTPFESQSKALQLRQMMQANDDAEYQRQQRAQAAADDASYRQALQANPNGGAGLLSALAGAGNYKGHAAAVKADLDQRKGAADLLKTQADVAETQTKTAKQAFEIHRDRINLVNDPQSAAAWVQEAFQDPVTGPIVSRVGDLQTALSKIPTDPAGFQQWKLQAGLASDAYVKHTSVDANTAANNTVSRENSQRTAASSKYATDSTAASARARLAFDQTKPAAGGVGVEPSMDASTIDRISAQVVGGDRTGLANMGRGAQGAANLVAIQNAVSKKMTERGMSPEDITAASAQLEGIRTGMRATGNISARVENAIAEAEQLAPLAIASGRNVSRSGLLPFGKAQVMFDTNTNDPELAKFAAANQGLVTAYASAMARGGKATVTDVHHAQDLLSTAKSQEAYEATVSQMQLEMKAASAAPKNVRAGLSSEISKRGGGGGHGAETVPNPFGGVPDDIAALLKKHGGK